MFQAYCNRDAFRKRHFGSEELVALSSCCHCVTLAFETVRHDGTTLTMASLTPSLARMMRTRAAIGVLLVGLSLASCRRDRAADLGIPDTTFVATLGELRRAETDTTLDPTMRDSTRRLILRRHKVTSVQLEHAARKLADSPARASDLWRKVESPPRIAPPPPRPGRSDSSRHPVATHPVPRS